MIRLAANLNWLFQEIPMTERFAAAAALGFKAVEILFPYRHGVAELVRAREAAGVEVALINSPMGEEARGEKGLACLPGRQAEFRASLALALDYAKALACRRLHVVAGVVPSGVDRGDCDRAYRENVRVAADICGAAGVTAMIEPINTRDIPGFYLSDYDVAAALVREIASPRLRLQFDFYHCQIIHGDLRRRFDAARDVLDHIQIADVPGRFEPGTGEINYPNVLAAVDASGYAGWVSCEYRPRTETRASLAWAKPYGISGN
jgi:hydroxypyruvate isomerase